MGIFECPWGKLLHKRKIEIEDIETENKRGG